MATQSENAKSVQPESAVFTISSTTTENTALANSGYLKKLLIKMHKKGNIEFYFYLFFYF